MKRLHNIQANHFNAIFYDIFVTASVLNSLSSWRFNEINEQLHPDSVGANQIVFTNTQTQQQIPDGHGSHVCREASALWSLQGKSVSRLPSAVNGWNPSKPLSARSVPLPLWLTKEWRSSSRLKKKNACLPSMTVKKPATSAATNILHEMICKEVFSQIDCYYQLLITKHTASSQLWCWDSSALPWVRESPLWTSEVSFRSFNPDPIVHSPVDTVTPGQIHPPKSHVHQIQHIPNINFKCHEL